MPRLLLVASSVCGSGFTAWRAGIRALGRSADVGLLLTSETAADERRSIAVALGREPAELTSRIVAVLPDARDNAPPLVGFGMPANTLTLEWIASWPGKKIFALDWEDPEWVSHLQVLADARVDCLLSERLPDEFPPLPRHLRMFVHTHNVWLPPCCVLPAADRVADAPAADVWFLATGRKDFGSTTIPEPPRTPASWTNLRSVVDTTPGLRSEELATLDLSMPSARQLLRARTWIHAPANPQCGMALDVMGAAAGIPTVNRTATYFSPLRSVVHGGLPRGLRSATAPLASLRQLFSVVVAGNSRPADSPDPSRVNPARALLETWAPAAFVRHLIHVAAGLRVENPGAAALKNLPWAEAPPAWRLPPKSPREAPVAPSAVAAVLAAREASWPEPVQALLEDLQTLASIWYELPLSRLTPGPALAARIARVMSATVGDEEQIGAILFPWASRVIDALEQQQIPVPSTPEAWRDTMRQLLTALPAKARQKLEGIEVRLLVEENRIPEAAQAAEAAYAGNRFARDLFAAIGTSLALQGRHAEAWEHLSRDRTLGRLSFAGCDRFARSLLPQDRDAENLPHLRDLQIGGRKPMDLCSRLANELAEAGDWKRAATWFDADFENATMSARWREGFARWAAHHRDWRRLRRLTERSYQGVPPPRPLVTPLIDTSIDLTPAATLPSPPEENLIDLQECLRREAGHFPASARTHLLWGRVSELLGDDETATAAYAHSFTATPNIQSVLVWLYFHLHRAHWSAIEQTFRRWAPLWPKGTIRKLLWKVAAPAWRESTRHRRAPSPSPVFEHLPDWLTIEFECGQDSPESTWTYIQLLFLAERISAIAPWTAEIREHPRMDPGARLRIVFLLWLREASEDARALFVGITPDDAWDVDTWSLFAVAATLLDESAAADQAFHRAVAIAPGHFRKYSSAALFAPWFLLTVACRHVGEERRVQELLEKAKCELPSDQLADRLELLATIPASRPPPGWTGLPAAVLST